MKPRKQGPKGFADFIVAELVGGPHCGKRFPVCFRTRGQLPAVFADKEDRRRRHVYEAAVRTAADGLPKLEIVFLYKGVRERPWPLGGSFLNGDELV